VTTLAVVLTIVGTSFGASGLALLLHRRALVAAGLMVAAGLGGVGAALLLAGGHEDVG
jgi:hypothetical protein